MTSDLNNKLIKKITRVLCRLYLYLQHMCYVVYISTYNTCVMSFISLLTTHVLCRLYLYTYNKNGLMYRVVCRIVTGTN